MNGSDRTKAGPVRNLPSSAVLEQERHCFRARKPDFCLMCCCCYMHEAAREHVDPEAVLEVRRRADRHSAALLQAKTVRGQHPQPRGEDQHARGPGCRYSCSCSCTAGGACLDDVVRGRGGQVDASRHRHRPVPAPPYTHHISLAHPRRLLPPLCSRPFYPPTARLPCSARHVRRQSDLP